jgi:CelD/BcsL family acetyltransferase involved in cellulose biosynthesis
LAGTGFPLRRSAARVCRFAELPATWEAFLARKSGRWRARLRYIETRLERRGSVALEVARDPAEVGPFFSEFVELHEARWGSSMDPAFLAFLRRLAPSLFRRGELLLARLRVGSTVTAA